MRNHAWGANPAFVNDIANPVPYFVCRVCAAEVDHCSRCRGIGWIGVGDDLGWWVKQECGDCGGTGITVASQVCRVDTAKARRMASTTRGGERG